jgi:HSP20 family molecular chaperone IbpA
MWAHALQMLDRAERIQQRFFDPGRAGQASWEPPVDIFETASGLFLVVALPGVQSEAIAVSFEGGACIVSGKRELPLSMEPAVIRRIEIPYGQFERRVALPPGHYELARREVVAGCLLLSLRKLG